MKKGAPQGALFLFSAMMLAALIEWQRVVQSWNGIDPGHQLAQRGCFSHHATFFIIKEVAGPGFCERESAPVCFLPKDPDFVFLMSGPRPT